MHRLFISDLHLESVDEPAFQRFSECLAAESKRVDEIYILGDLVEMWIGDDDDSPAARALIASLAQASGNCTVYIMHGNRDFLFGDAFIKATGTQLLPDPYCTPDGLLLSHGDALCTDDAQYQQMRALLRSDAWQQDILSKTLDERQVLGAGLRTQSKQNNANKPTNIMDVNFDATTALIQAHGAHTIIHGHTHRPGIHDINGARRVVTGAWERCGWLARQQGDETRLECFSLARRYEI